MRIGYFCSTDCALRLSLCLSDSGRRTSRRVFLWGISLSLDLNPSVILPLPPFDRPFSASFVLFDTYVPSFPSSDSKSRHESSTFSSHLLSTHLRCPRTPLDMS